MLAQQSLLQCCIQLYSHTTRVMFECLMHLEASSFKRDARTRTGNRYPIPETNSCPRTRLKSAILFAVDGTARPQYVDRVTVNRSRVQRKRTAVDSADHQLTPRHLEGLHHHDVCHSNMQPCTSLRLEIMSSFFQLQSGRALSRTDCVCIPDALSSKTTDTNR
jgi:hypothetical protein